MRFVNGQLDYYSFSFIIFGNFKIESLNRRLVFFQTNAI